MSTHVVHSPMHGLLTVEVDEHPSRYNQSLRARLVATYLLGITVSALCRGAPLAPSSDAGLRAPTDTLIFR